MPYHPLKLLQVSGNNLAVQRRTKKCRGNTLQHQPDSKDPMRNTTSMAQLAQRLRTLARHKRPCALPHRLLDCDEYTTNLRSRVFLHIPTVRPLQVVALFFLLCTGCHSHLTSSSFKSTQSSALSARSETSSTTAHATNYSSSDGDRDEVSHQGEQEITAETEHLSCALPVPHDPSLSLPLQARVTTLLSAPSLASRLVGAPISLLVVSATQPLAYSCDGQFVVISTGLITSLSSPDSVSFVIAHEIAHIALHHEADKDPGSPRALDLETEADTLAARALSEIGINPLAGVRAILQFERGRPDALRIRINGLLRPPTR